MRRRTCWVAVAGLVLFALAYLAPLGARPLFAPDELRYTEIAREMLVSGDWVVPHLEGIRYFEKPILGYWVHALSIHLLGVNAFAMRLPSVVAVGLTGAVLALLVSIATGARRAAAATVAAYLTTLEVHAVGITAVLDSLLALFITATLSAFFLAAQAESARTRSRLLWASGLCCGLGLLTKGFIALAIPLVVVVPFLLWERRTRELARLAWRPLAGAALVVLPWGLCISLRERDFWHYFIWVQHLQRFVSASSGQHPRPLWFLAPFVLVGGLPWILLLPAALVGWRAHGLSTLGRFAICWLVAPALLVSLSDGKLGTYVLPCFAPLAILVAPGLESCSAHGVGARAFRVGALTTSFLCSLLAALMLWDRWQTTLAPDLHAWLDKLRWPLLVGGLLGWSLLAACASRARVGLRTGLSAAGPLCMMLLAGWSMPPGISSRVAPLGFVARYAPMVGNDAQVVATPPAAYAASVVFGSDQVFLLARGELGYGLDYPESSYRLLSNVGVQELVADEHRERDVVVLAQRDRYAALAALLPGPDLEVASDGLVLALFHGAATRGSSDLMGRTLPSQQPERRQASLDAGTYKERPDSDHPGSDRPGGLP